jgi:hypothetical protein
MRAHPAEAFMGWVLVFRNVACLRGLLCRLPEAGAVSPCLEDTGMCLVLVAV